MQPWQFIEDRWPSRILEIRRKCARDREFRSIVSDYADAQCALAHWRGVDPAASERITDYERLVREFEDEIDRSLTA